VLACIFARSGLIGFDPKTGKRLFGHPWRARIFESVNAANPIVSDDTILISESYERGSSCLTWNGKTLTEQWNDKDKDRVEQSLMAHFCTPIEVNGYVYGSSSRHSADADFRCLELKTGEVQWKVTRTRWLTMAKVNDWLILLTENGEIRIVKPNPVKYEEIAKWDADLAHPAWAPPVISDGMLFVRGKEKLICYDLRAK
jgi:outer membrane protein assembly factor BamB